MAPRRLDRPAAGRSGRREVATPSGKPAVLIQNRTSATFHDFPFDSPARKCPHTWVINTGPPGYDHCLHRCIYCYARDAIYARPSGGKTVVYGNLPALVRRDLERFSLCPPVSLSNATDPCQEIPALRARVGQLVELLVQYGVSFCILTKNDPSFLLEVEGFPQYDRKFVAVTIEGSEKVLELLSPAAPPFRERLDAVERLARLGLPVSIRLDPVFPHLFRALYGERWYTEVEVLIRRFASAGARHIVASTGTLKKRAATAAWGGVPSYERIRQVVGSLSPAEASAFCRDYAWDGTYTSHGYRLRHNLRLPFHQFVKGLTEGSGMTYSVCLELSSDEADSEGVPCCEGFSLPFVRRGADGRFHPIERCTGNCLRCSAPGPPCGRSGLKTHGPLKASMLV